MRNRCQELDAELIKCNTAFVLHLWTLLLLNGMAETLIQQALLNQLFIYNFLLYGL